MTQVQRRNGPCSYVLEARLSIEDLVEPGLPPRIRRRRGRLDERSDRVDNRLGLLGTQFKVAARRHRIGA
jgi:hypothetical protein